MTLGYNLARLQEASGEVAKAKEGYQVKVVLGGGVVCADSMR